VLKCLATSQNFIHGKDFVPNYQTLTNKEAIDELDRILSFYAVQSHKYQHSKCSNALESFNRSIVAAVSKNLSINSCLIQGKRTKPYFRRMKVF
jgi:hypothetical protein